jgi:hypothetical protein
VTGDCPESEMTGCDLVVTSAILIPFRELFEDFSFEALLIDLDDANRRNGRLALPKNDPIF